MTTVSATKGITREEGFREGEGIGNEEKGYMRGFKRERGGYERKERESKRGMGGLGRKKE